MGTTLHKHLVSVLYSGLILIALQSAAHAQGIVATHSTNGRVVYENAPDKPANANPTPAADTGMVYWSNTEHRWKPVPPMYSKSARAAQSAAQEVRRLIREAARKDPQFAANGNALQIASEQVQSQQPESKSAIAAVMTPELVQPKKQVVARSGRSPVAARRRLAAYAQAPSAPGWIDNVVAEAALRHAVDPNLVRAIIRVESNFNPHAVSRKGAIGLMQLMPRTARSLNVRNPYDPAQNVDAGVRHFKELLDSYGGNLELSLAAYNAGIGAVHRSRGVPNYSETRKYVKRITGIYGSNTTQLVASGHPLEIKRDAQGHMSVSDLE